MDKTDKELIREYVSGNEDAFYALANRHLKPVYNFVYRIVLDRSEADDAVQETFLKLWRNIGKYKEDENFKSWLYRIARNTAIDSLRKKNRKKPIAFSFLGGNDDTPIEETIADPAPLPDELVALAENKELVESLLKNLSPSDREIIVLKYAEQMTFNEIGEILGEPLNTVKSRHRRALLKLREFLLKLYR